MDCVLVKLSYVTLEFRARGGYSHTLPIRVCDFEAPD